jgi:hypothetical protein
VFKMRTGSARNREPVFIMDTWSFRDLKLVLQPLIRREFEDFEFET